MKNLTLLTLVVALAAPLGAQEKVAVTNLIADRTAFFKSADLNKNGSINRDEAAAFAGSARTLRKLIQVCDLNLDRKISLSEFLAVPADRMPINIPRVSPPPNSVTQFIGLPLEEAIALAEREGRRWRVIIPGHIYTMEYIESRVNFYLTDGIVTKATQG